MAAEPFAQESMTEMRQSSTFLKTTPTFHKNLVQRILAEVCEQLVGDREYVFEETQPLIKELCGEIQQRVMELDMSSYKIVTQVTIVEAAQHGIRVASRCLWDPDMDNYAAYTYSSEHMHVNVLTFGLYWE